MNRLQVWAPNAQRVSVVGDFNAWDGRVYPMRRRLEGGVWEIFIPGIAEGAQELRLTKSRLEKFAKEGAAFLCACNSGKPVAFTGMIAFRQRRGQYQLSDVRTPMGTEHARELRKNFLSLWIQVEDPVHQGHVDAFVCHGKTLSIALLKLEMRKIDQRFSSTRTRQHSFTKVDSDDPPCRPYSPRGDD